LRAPPRGCWSGELPWPPRPPRRSPSRRDEIRCAGEACAIGACLLQELSRDPDRLLRAARIVPVAAQDKVHGFRLFGLRPGSLLARLGIVNGDVVLALSGQPLTTPDQALAALGALRSADSVLLGLEREGRPLARRVLFDRRPLRDDKCPKPAPSADSDGRPQPVSLKRPDPGPQEALRRITKDLRCQGDRCTLHRSTVDEILGHSELFAQSARLIPVFKKGRAQGFKVLGLRPGSLLALLGLRNGDEVREINGFDLTSPERALEAYVSLRSATELRVGLLRSGAPVTRTYVIVP
jgi:type II secretory pathway component PulC